MKQLIDLAVGITTFILVVGCKPIVFQNDTDASIPIGVRSLQLQAVDCKKLPTACTFIIQQGYQDDMTHRKYAYLCAAWMAACNQQPPVNPPPNAGGSISTGGTSAIGPRMTGGNSAIGGRPSNATGGETSKSQCQALCDHLVAIGCPSQQSSCVSLCSLHTGDSRFSQNITCEMNSSNVAAAQKCGPASCR